TEPPPPEPSTSRTIGSRSSFAICSAWTCFWKIDASAAPPRTVKSSPATTTGRPSIRARPITKFAGVKPASCPSSYSALPVGATAFLLVRRGESQPGDPDRPFDLVAGHGDPPLDPVGVDQAERLAERLAGEDIAGIYVTTLRRTVETAAPLAKRLGIVPSVEPELREVYLGEWEGGLLRVKAAEHDPAFVRAVEEQRWDLIPGGEPADVFRDR